MGASQARINLGASFSLHRCSELQIDKRQCLEAALCDLGIKHFRLMSYWNIHEPTKGFYNFEELDWQVELIARYGGTVSLCLGKRQPRWPECHMPFWAQDLPKAEWHEALFAYIKAVVQRYKGSPTVTSWQLENEAKLKAFGHCPDQDYSSQRLRKEFALIRKLDPGRPIIMSLSNNWGLPFRRPIPDSFGISIYTLMSYGKKDVQKTIFLPTWHRFRSTALKLLFGKSVFIHELQAEPWLKNSVTECTTKFLQEQFGPEQLLEAVDFAKKTGLKRADLWGLEYWYWLKTEHHDSSMWNETKRIIARNL